MDILITIRDFFINQIYNLPESFTTFILRMGLLLALSAGFLLFIWVYSPWRTVFSQTCVAFLATICALYTPVEKFRDAGKEFLTFSIILALLCMIFLPGKISFLLTPRFGNQLKLKRIIIYVILGLFALQIIIGG